MTFRKWHWQNFWKLLERLLNLRFVLFVLFLMSVTPLHCKLSVQFQANLDLTVKTLDLLVAFTKLHFMLRVVENKEVMLGMYGAAYQQKNKSEHKDFQRFETLLICLNAYFFILARKKVA